MSTYNITLKAKEDSFFTYLENGKIKAVKRIDKNTSWDDAVSIDLTEKRYTKISMTFFDGVNSTPSVTSWDITSRSKGTDSNEWLSSGSNQTILSGGKGNDILFGSVKNDTLDGGVGNDVLIGRDGRDAMKGGSGDDTYVIWNGSGPDVIDDSSGAKDLLRFETNTGSGTTGGLTTYRDGNSLFFRSYTGENTWDEGEIKNFQKDGTIEWLHYIDGDGPTFYISLEKDNTGTSTSDWISSTKRGDTLKGLSGDDILIGYTGADKLEGGAGNDYIYGMNANDTLVGGTGTDTLIGGKGRDVFDFNSINESRVGGARDKIHDFLKGFDKIDLMTIDANTAVSKGQAFKFATKAAANSVWYAAKDVDGSTATKDIIVYGDVNGDATADFEIGLVGVTSIAATDFVLK
jgi:Ca2+-binding RTX toxin-like protein